SSSFAVRYALIGVLPWSKTQSMERPEGSAQSASVLRAAAPVVPAVAAVGLSFGVLARTEHFGSIAAVVFSATTFAGSSQIAAVSLLGAGGTVGAAIVAALLLNARYAPIGINVARLFHGSAPKRFVEAQLVVDESWALS